MGVFLNDWASENRFRRYNNTMIGSEPQYFNLSCSDFLEFPSIPWALQTSWVRSPACASSARHWVMFASLRSSGLDPNWYPPGMHGGDRHIQFHCCGGCMLYASAVQVLYWSSTSDTDCSRPNTSITTYASLNEVQTVTTSYRSYAANFAVVDESTLTFPSLYMAVQGTVSVNDMVGPRGSKYFNPTIPIPPGGLSSISLCNYWRWIRNGNPTHHGGLTRTTLTLLGSDCMIPLVC